MGLKQRGKPFTSYWLKQRKPWEKWQSEDLGSKLVSATILLSINFSWPSFSHLSYDYVSDFIYIYIFNVYYIYIKYIYLIHITCFRFIFNVITYEYEVYEYFKTHLLQEKNKKK